MVHGCGRFLAALGVAALLSPTSAWAQAGPDLVIAMSHSGNFTVGANGIYTIVVSNIGGAASGGQIDVFDPLTQSLSNPVFSFVSATGTGWTCSLSGFPFDTAHCLTAAVIPASGSAPPITLTVVPNVSGTVTNTANVAGGGETNTTNDSASDVTLVIAAVPTLPEWALIALTVLLAGAGVTALRTTSAARE
jgi:uncharacterized repeat protein (TIGR01451 family)